MPRKPKQRLHSFLPTLGIAGVLALVAWLTLGDKEPWSRLGQSLVFVVVVLVPALMASLWVLPALAGWTTTPERPMRPFSDRFYMVLIGILVFSMSAAVLLLCLSPHNAFLATTVSAVALTIPVLIVKIIKEHRIDVLLHALADPAQKEYRETYARLLGLLMKERTKTARDD